MAKELEKKRYILFGCDDYYPCGGMNDAITSFNDGEYDSVVAEQEEVYKCDWYHVFDTKTFKLYEGQKKREIPRINVIND